jgi:hypothetical protein
LLSTDRATAVTLDPIGDGKIRVRTSTWDQEVVILGLEVVALGKSPRLVRAPRSLEYMDYDPLGFADAGYARSNEVTASHR